MAVSKCDKWMFTICPILSLKSLVHFIILWSSFHLATTTNVKYGHCCENQIYCYGSVLHTIQMAGIFADSKTFVDMKIKSSEKEVLSKFDDLMRNTSNTPSKSEIDEFVKKNFDREGSEFEAWDPPDWKPTPKLLTKVKDDKYRDWVNQLHLLWKFLGRKIKDDVKTNPEKYSIIYVPNPVIVPGGRFREFYYWDSYWIIKGLLLSEMTETVRGMLENFLHIVDVYGHIPNGGRIYYIMRSHPPLLVPMIQLYYEHTKDLDFIKKHINTMETEFHFWMNNRTVKISKDNADYILCRYNEASVGPRPESYREDIEMGHVYSDDEDKNTFYTELKSAAESGWDFSTRWFIVNGTNKGNLTNIKTSYIIPVDLNAFVHGNAVILSSFYKLLGNLEKSAEYQEKADEWLEAIEQILWHDEVGTWLDYDLMDENKRDYFYPSNVIPLWTGSYRRDKVNYYVSKVLKYLERTQVMNNLGGIPTSLEHSGEQWDFPNAWAPLQHMMVMGLDNTGDAWAQDLAYEIASRWTKSNWLAYNKTRVMMEKYDASVPGGHGGGGEYEVQMGFGWSNAVVMDLLDKYSDKLKSDEDASPIDSSNPTERENELLSGSSWRPTSMIHIVFLCLVAVVVRYV